jgi:hypothetical protein
MKDSLWRLASSCGLKLLPLIGQPSREFVHSRRWQVYQRLREVELRGRVMATAGAGKDGHDRRRPPPIMS